MNISIGIYNPLKVCLDVDSPSIYMYSIVHNCKEFRAHSAYDNLHM